MNYRQRLAAARRRSRQVQAARELDSGHIRGVAPDAGDAMVGVARGRVALLILATLDGSEQTVARRLDATFAAALPPGDAMAGVARGACGLLILATLDGS